MKKLYLLTGLIAVIVFFGCKTASKMYKKGNYDEAVSLAAKKLQKDPNDAKLQSLIQSSYRYAVEDHQNNISNHSASTNELKWEWMYNDYLSLQNMYQAIRTVPSVFRIVHPTDYSSELNTYANKAGEVRYQRGINFMKTDDKQGYRNAYNEFRIALNYRPADVETQQMMNEAYKNAVVNVIILPVQQGGYQYSSYNPGARNFEERVVNSLKQSITNQFVKFYSEWDAKSNNVRPDEIIDMRFSNIDAGHYYDKLNKRQVSKEVVIKEIVYKPDSVVKQYGKVYAQITTTSRKMHSEALLQVSVRNSNGDWLWNDNFSANDYWNTEFASYTGDIRALGDDDIQLINRPVQQPPRKEDVIQCMMEEINNNLLYKLKNHYSTM